MPTATSISNISDNFIHSPSDVARLIDNPTRPTKVEVQDVINQSTINLVNIPDPDCVGDVFGFPIIATTHPEWIVAELARLNELRIEASQETRRQEDAAALADIPPCQINPNHITYTEAIEADSDPYLDYSNPSRFVIDPTWNGNETTIA